MNYDKGIETTDALANKRTNIAKNQEVLATLLNTGRTQVPTAQNLATIRPGNIVKNDLASREVITHDHYKL